MFLAPTYAILPWQSSEPVLWVRLSADHDKLAESPRGAWHEAGEPCACPPRARGGGTLTHRCSTTLGFPAASEALSASAKEISVWQACFIWDNTNQVRPVASWLHLFNAKFQIGCYCHTSVIIFKAKKCCEVWCKDWTNTQPLRIRNKAPAFGRAARLCVMLSWDSSALATEVCSRAPVFWLLLQSFNRKTTPPGADPHLK